MATSGYQPELYFDEISQRWRVKSKYGRRPDPAELNLPPLPPWAPGRATCPLCMKTYASHRGLMTHYEKHLDQKRYSCDCGRDFNIYSSYRHHVVSCTGRSTDQPAD